MPKCSLGVLALGMSSISRIDHAKAIGEIDNFQYVIQPCYPPPNLSVTTQLFLELCLAMRQQGGCCLGQRMWTLSCHLLLVKAENMLRFSEGSSSQ